MENSEQNLSYYELRLRELLISSFPEKMNDQKFIEQRATSAASIYERAFLDGNPIAQCNEIATYTLFEGLHFSKFDTVFSVVCQEFDSLMMDQELRPFSLKMLPVCEPIFQQYILTDDFAYGHEYDLLYTEITGTVAIWIEEYGL